LRNLWILVNSDLEQSQYIDSVESGMVRGVGSQ